MNNIKIRRLAAGSGPFLSGSIAMLLAVAIVLSPEASFQASLQGLKLWWTVVFPALLPFLMLSEMLTASGFVHGFGILLEPLMTRLFRLPGTGGWTLALGATAGFPGGASGVMQLHQQGSITDKEAGRLASLVHFASPVTLLIVVGVAFLHSPSAGYSLLAIHWLSGLLAGWTATRFHKRQTELDTSAANTAAGTRSIKREPLHTRILQAAAEARSRDGRSFGKLLGEAVAAAVQNLMIIGGYMIIFAVLIQILTALFPQLPQALPAGLLEIHLGAGALSSALPGSNAFSISGIPGMALMSAALGWSGICAQLQALTVLKPAGVRFLPYAAVRLLHGLYAFVLTVLLWKPLMAFREAVLPAMAVSTGKSAEVSPAVIWSVFPQLLGLQFILLLLLLLTSAAIYVASRTRRPFE